ncbi:MAG TPA: hypothetical protein VFH55_06310 [Nitrospiria bacterium]|nr:hypothetical protein [Nitrospiria bacterium]
MEGSKNIEGLKKELIVTKDILPLRIQYGDKHYILILTKNGKLLLNKISE